MSLLLGATLMGATIPVTDASVLGGLSPYNWVCKEGSISSTVNGASITLIFKGTRQVVLQVATDHLTTQIPTRFPIIAWSVNGGATQTYQLVANANEVMLSSGIADPNIEIYLKGMSPFEDRFTGDVPANALKITGFAVDAGGSVIAPNHPGKVWLNIGDSILSGDGASYAKDQGRPPDDAWAASEDGRASYCYLLVKHFGYQEARLAYGGYNWGGGMAGMPALDTLIDQRTSTVSRLVDGKLSPSPDVVLVNLGENGEPTEAAVVKGLVKLRSRVSPTTKILVMVPVSGRVRDEVKSAFQSYKNSANDGNADLVDAGQVAFDTCDGQHPTAAGHLAIYNAVLPVIENIMGVKNFMKHEPVLFIQKAGKPFATGKLMFVPTEKPIVMAPDQLTIYQEGADYHWQSGSDVLELTADSRIPFKTAAELTPPLDSPNRFKGVFFSEGRLIHDLQMQVSYPHVGVWPLKVASRGLTRSIKKLSAGQPFKLVALGDSITEGYNASGFKPSEAPPYQPPYPELVAQALQARFGAKIALTNLGRAGTQAGWGMTKVAEVASETPDLVILAFGMNHDEAAPVFEAAMRKLRDAIQAACPAADIVLVAPMTGNPQCFPVERFVSYRDALRNLTNDHVAVADVTSPWLELLQRKPFHDLSGNNVNHPNDFSHRLYAQVIGELFPLIIEPH